MNADGRQLYAKRAWVHGGVLKLSVPADAVRLTVYASSEARGGLAATGVHTSAAVKVVPLGPGARGEAVAGMKRRLAALAFHQATLEPAWTSDTFDVVLAFQKAVGLPRTGSPTRQRCCAWRRRRPSSHACARRTPTSRSTRPGRS